MLPVRPFLFIRKHHNDANSKKNSYIIFVVAYMLLLIKQMDQHQNEDTLQNFCKVATGIYVTTSPYFVIFSQIKKNR